MLTLCDHLVLKTRLGARERPNITFPSGLKLNSSAYISYCFLGICFLSYKYNFALFSGFTHRFPRVSAPVV